ncbi:MAG TPA: MlaD family protein [Candidatus Kapabacteria bacterium]|nr:MlaD family protein [Candidatus Kapabacteria bacterium]
MKISKAPVIRTGFFIILCFSLLVIGVFLIGDKQKLFSNTYNYYAKLKEVNGLKEGAQVQISGINVGSVSTINLPEKAGDSVVVKLYVVKNALHLIHVDSKVSIITEGLVGNKALSISVGAVTSEPIPPGSFIPGVSGFELGTIMDTVTLVATNTNAVLRNLNGLIEGINSGKGTLGSLLTNDQLYIQLTKTIGTTNDLMANISSTVGTANSAMKNLTSDVEQSASAVREILEKLRTGNGTVAKLVNDSGLYVDLEGSLKSLSSSIFQVKDLMQKLTKTAGNTEEVTEALKHNFLVKGYFEDQGYWNAADYEAKIDRKLDTLRMIEQKLKEANR